MSKVSPNSSKAAARVSKSATAGSGSGSGGKGKLPVPLLIGGGIFMVIIFVFVYMMFGGDKKQVEQNVEVVIPQSSELDTGKDSSLMLPVEEEPVEEVNPEFGVVEEDPFASSDPINALTESAVLTAIKSDPSYTENVGMLMPDGTMFGENTVEFSALKKEVGTPVHSDLSTLMSTQETADGEIWMFLDATSGQGSMPLASQEAKGKATSYAIQSATRHLQDVKALYSQPVAPVVAANEQGVAQQVAPTEVIVERIVEVSSINDEERQLLNSIVQELRTQNKSAKSDLQTAKEDKRNAEKELVQLRQRVEDNPALKNIVRATMLPSSTGYKLDAVMGDKIFLRNIKTDDITILQQGQNIPSTSYSISSADMDTGIVLVTPSK